MARFPAIFRQGDVTRAVRAVVAAGQAVARVDIDPNGKIVVVMVREPDEREEENSWDRV